METENKHEQKKQKPKTTRHTPVQLLQFSECYFAKNNHPLLKNNKSDIDANKFMFFMIKSKNPEIDNCLFRTLIERGVVGDNEVRLISFVIEEALVYVIELEKSKTRRNRLAMFILINPSQQYYRSDVILQKSFKFFHPNENKKGYSIVNQNKEMSYNSFLDTDKIRTKFNQTPLEQFILDIDSMASDNHSHLSKQLIKNENNKEFCRDFVAIIDILSECAFMIKKTEQCLPPIPLFSMPNREHQEIDDIIKTSKSLDKFGIAGLINKTALEQGIIEKFETGQEYIFKNKQRFKSLFRYGKTGTWASKKYIDRTTLIYPRKQNNSDEFLEMRENICKKKDSINTFITEEDGTVIKTTTVHFEQFYFNEIVNIFKDDIDHIFFDASTIKKTLVMAAVAIVPYDMEAEKDLPIKDIKFTYKTIMLFTFPDIVEFDESGKQLEQFFGASLYKSIIEMIIEVYPKIKSITTDFESAVINGSLEARLKHWGCLVHYNTNLENRFSKAKQRGLKIASKMRTILGILPLIKLPVDEKRLLDYIEDLEEDITREEDQEILNEVWSYYFQRKGKKDNYHKLIFNHNAVSLLDQVDQFKLTNNAVERVFKKLKSNLRGFTDNIKEKHYQMTVELLIDHLYKQHISDEFVGQCKPHFKPSKYNEIIRHADEILSTARFEYKSDLKANNLAQLKTTKRIRKSKRNFLKDEEIEQLELLTGNKHKNILPPQKTKNEMHHAKSERLKSRSITLQKRGASTVNEQLKKTITDLTTENASLKRIKTCLNRDKLNLELKLNKVQQELGGVKMEAEQAKQKTLNLETELGGVKTEAEQLKRKTLHLETELEHTYNKFEEEKRARIALEKRILELENRINKSQSTANSH